MPYDLSDTLVVGISATALFDLSEADSVFRRKFESNREEAIEEYREYMAARESDGLKPGTRFYLVKALLSLNQFQSGDKAPLVEVVVMSRNSPETGVRVFHNIRSIQCGSVPDHQYQRCAAGD